jgi:hypothetical protein
VTKQSFDNAKKTHRAAIATKTRGKTRNGNSRIPKTVDAAAKFAAVKAAAQQKRSHERNHSTKPER